MDKIKNSLTPHPSSGDPHLGDKNRADSGKDSVDRSLAKGSKKGDVKKLEKVGGNKEDVLPANHNLSESVEKGIHQGDGGVISEENKIVEGELASMSKGYKLEDAKYKTFYAKFIVSFSVLATWPVFRR